MASAGAPAENCHPFKGDAFDPTGMVPCSEIKDIFGAPLLVIHRADLPHMMMVLEARKLDIPFQLGASVGSTNFSSFSVQTSGMEFEGDVILAADGVKSFCPSSLPPSYRKTFYRFTMTFDKMRQLPSLQSLIDPPKVTCWLGPASQVVFCLPKSINYLM